MAAPLVNVYYTKPIMPDVSRVLACLYEKKIEFEPIDIYEGQNSISMDLFKLRSRASRRIHGVAIEDGETRLFESRAICRYLAEKYGNRGTSLLGKDPLERAAIEQWIKFEEQKFDPPSWALAFYLGFAPPPLDAAAIKDDVRKLGDVLDVYEQRLTESEFLAGDDFTMADLFHLPTSHHILSHGSSHKTYVEVSELFTSRKNVNRWWKTISSRPSWKNVIDFLSEVPPPKSSILADSPESKENLQPFDSSTMSSKAARMKTMAEIASQLGLPPASQSTEHVSQAKANSKQGDESEPTVSRQNRVPNPPSDPRLSDFKSTLNDMSEASLQARPQTPKPAHGSPLKTESQASASSSSSSSEKGMNETSNIKGADKAQSKREEKSSLSDGKKSSPESVSLAQTDSPRTVPITPIKDGKGAAIPDAGKTEPEKQKLKGDDEKSTKIDKTAPPQPTGSSSPPQASRSAVASTDDVTGSKSDKIGEVKFLNPGTKINSVSLPSSVAKGDTKTSSQGGSRNREMPNNPTKTGSQGEPSSNLPSRKDDATKPGFDNQPPKRDLSEANRPPLTPAGSSPGPAAESKPARPAANSGGTQSIQGSKADGASPSRPETVNGESESSSDQAGRKGDAPSAPNADADS